MSAPFATFQEAGMTRLTLALAGTLLLAGSACADPGASLIVTGHQLMEGSADEETGEISGCEIPTSIGEGTRSHDVFINLADAANTGFTLGLLMENRLDDSSDYAPIGESQNMRLDQNAIEIQAYAVNFDSGDSGFNTLGADADGEIRYESTGIVPTEGVLYSQLVLFYPNEAAEWRDAFSIAAQGQSNAIVSTFAEVQVLGRTIGGAKVESNLLTLPIQICDGCARQTTPICVAVE